MGTSERVIRSPCLGDVVYGKIGWISKGYVGIRCHAEWSEAPVCRRGLGRPCTWEYKPGTVGMCRPAKDTFFTTSYWWMLVPECELPLRPVTTAATWASDYFVCGLVIVPDGEECTWEWLRDKYNL